MYKILIADDEKPIRQGLSKMFESGKYGFCVAEIMGNGEDVIEYIKKNSIDVILADIKMPFATGLDIAKYVSENKLDIIVVLCSGYDDFEYAKQAIGYGVFDYLLKPTSVDEIKKVFNKIKDVLDCKNVQKIKINHMQAKLSYNNKILIEQFFADLSLGFVSNTNELKTRMESIGIVADVTSDAIIFGKILFNKFDEHFQKKTEHNKDDFMMLVENVIYMKTNGMKCLFQTANDYVNLLFVLLEKEIESVDCEKIISEICNEISNISKIVCSYEIKLFTRIVEFNEFIIMKKNNNSILETDEWFYNKKRKLLSEISINAFENINSLLIEIVDRLQNYDIILVKENLTSLFSDINVTLKNIGLNIYSITKDKFSFQVLHSLKSMKDIVEWVSIIANTISATIESNKDTNDYIIIKAKKYINENYNKNLSLNEVASTVYLSSSYFSKLFSERTSMTYIDYLIKVRMEKASELLKDLKYKIYEVSELVGYTNVRHFANLFNKYTGYNPNQFRKNLRNELHEKN